MTIVELIRRMQGFVSFSGAEQNAIYAAEHELGLLFANDYKEYLHAFGAVSYKGHELTGVCKSNALNVVNVTQKEKEFTDVPDSWYVVEQAHIDGIVFWQTQQGTIYMTKPGAGAQKVCDSLIEYVSGKEV